MEYYEETRHKVGFFGIIDLMGLKLLLVIYGRVK